MLRRASHQSTKRLISTTIPSALFALRLCSNTAPSSDDINKEPPKKQSRLWLKYLQDVEDVEASTTSASSTSVSADLASEPKTSRTQTNRVDQRIDEDLDFAENSEATVDPSLCSTSTGSNVENSVSEEQILAAALRAANRDALGKDESDDDDLELGAGVETNDAEEFDAEQRVVDAPKQTTAAASSGAVEEEELDAEDLLEVDSRLLRPAVRHMSEGAPQQQQQEAEGKSSSGGELGDIATAELDLVGAPLNAAPVKRTKK